MITKKVPKFNLDQLATKNDLHELEIKLAGRIDGLDDFMHKVMKELQDFRQEQSLLSSLYGRFRDMEDQVEKLENIHPNYRHITA